MCCFGVDFFNRVAIMHILVSTKFHFSLTHWGWAMHICVCRLTIIVSDNGLLPGWLYQTTSAGILLIGPLGTNFSEILLEILTFSLKKMSLKVLTAKLWQLCLGLNVWMYRCIAGKCWWRCEHDESFMNAAKVFLFGFCCCCWMSEIFNVLEMNFSTVSSNQGLYTAILWQWI